MTLKTPISTYKNHLDLIYSTASFQVALISGSLNNYGFTLDPGNLSQINCTGHGFLNKNRVRFSASLGGTLPTGMVADQDYYVVNKSTNTFQVALTLNGTPAVFTSLGSNDSTIMSVQEQALDPDLDSLDLWVNHEVEYSGSSRQTYTPGVSSIGIVEEIKMAYTQPQTIFFAPTTSSVSAQYLLFIKDGTLVRGNTTGTIERVQDYESNFLIASGEIKGFIVSERKY